MLTNRTLSTPLLFFALLAGVVTAAPAWAQIPAYELDPSAARVVRLYNLSPGDCHPNSISGRVVKREFDRAGLALLGFVIETPSGERNYININQTALDAASIGLTSRAWFLTGLQTLLSEGKDVSLGVRLCGASGRVVMLDAVSASTAPAANSSATVEKYGPSFDCGTKAVANQPLAQMICVSPELSLWELGYVIAYQALREAESPAGKKAMVEGANSLVVDMNSACDIPTAGRIQRPPTANEVACIRSKFQTARNTLVARSSGPAREEATLEPRETVAIQRGLQLTGHLSMTATLDGVFGPMTRTAIASWQRDSGQRETGYGSRSMLALFGGAQFATAAPTVPPAAPPAPPSSNRSALSIDRAGKSSSIRLALGDGTEMKPQDVFEKVGGAVYVVKSEKSLGSAVAVSDRELLTNCHVVGDSVTVTLEREGAKFPAAVVSAHQNADRCILRASGIVEPLPMWVRVRPYADVKVGERVFTVGAPRGLELSLAEGIVSSKRVLDDTRLFQTSAPISRGSSGGGLFDGQGNLIGITTFMIKDAQNINFAIAAEEYVK